MRPLADLARTVTAEDPMSGHLFLFRSRGCDRLKALYWDTRSSIANAPITTTDAITAHARCTALRSAAACVRGRKRH